MDTAIPYSATHAGLLHAWRGLEPGPWTTRIDVRDFILRNVSPYDGDEGFLAAATDRTKAVWAALQPYFRAEAKQGALEADGKTPSTMTAHAPGYIDRPNEVIVGL